MRAEADHLIALVNNTENLRHSSFLKTVFASDHHLFPRAHRREYTRQTTSKTLAWDEENIAPYLSCLSPETSKASSPLRPLGAIFSKATDEMTLGSSIEPQVQLQDF